MKAQKLSTWLAIGANVGVIVSILFLAFEISQSTKATVAAATESVIGGYNTLNLPIIADPQVARVFVIGLYEPDALTDVEAVQFAMWLRSQVNQHLKIRELNRRGLISDALEGGDVQQLARLLSTPGGKLFFEGNKDVIPRELLEEMEPYLGQELKSDFTLGRDSLPD
jgi:hypothetical protein